MRIVYISDTHGFHERLVVPDGDVLIHAGDFCDGRDAGAVSRFARWLEAQPHQHKIVGLEEAVDPRESLSCVALKVEVPRQCVVGRPGIL